MKYRVELHPEAVIELQEAYNWYEKMQRGLGTRFISGINERFEALSLYPEIHPLKKNGYREVCVTDFPYVVIYEVFKKECVVFVSYVFHTKRDPRVKYKR